MNAAPSYLSENVFSLVGLDLPTNSGVSTTTMKKLDWARRSVKTSIILAITLGAAAIAKASFGYFGEEMPLFVVEKLPLPYEETWLRVLKFHVAASLFCLPACLLLLSTSALKRLRGLHRWLGRITGMVTLLVLVPSGAYMAFFAKGGVLGTIGFLLTGTIVAVAMVLGIHAARRRRIVEHRRWMLHVAAQMSVAVISRVMMLGFDAFAFDPSAAYLISLWLPVIGGFLVVESISEKARAASARRARRTSHFAAHEHAPHPV